MPTNVSMTPADWLELAERVREVASKCADATYMELSRYALALDHVATAGARDKVGTLIAAYSALSPYAQIYVNTIALTAGGRAAVDEALAEAGGFDEP